VNAPEGARPWLAERRRVAAILNDQSAHLVNGAAAHSVVRLNQPLTLREGQELQIEVLA